MNRRLGLMVAGFLLVGMATSASAVFVVPTDAQLAAAAAAPTTALAALLQDASADEAASVVASVAERVLGMGLSAVNEAQLLTELTATLFDIMPSDQRIAVAAALGRAQAANPTLSGNQAAVATIRGALASVGGTEAAEMIAAYDQQVRLGVGAPSSGGTDEPVPEDGEVAAPVLHPPPPDDEPESGSPTPTPTPTPTPDPTPDPTPTPSPEPPPSDPYVGQTL